MSNKVNVCKAYQAVLASSNSGSAQEKKKGADKHEEAENFRAILAKKLGKAA